MFNSHRGLRCLVMDQASLLSLFFFLLSYSVLALFRGELRVMRAHWFRCSLVSAKRNTHPSPLSSPFVKIKAVIRRVK